MRDDLQQSNVCIAHIGNCDRLDFYSTEGDFAETETGGPEYYAIHFRTGEGQLAPAVSGSGARCDYEKNCYRSHRKQRSEDCPGELHGRFIVEIYRSIEKV